MIVLTQDEEDTLNESNGDSSPHYYIYKEKLVRDNYKDIIPKKNIKVIKSDEVYYEFLKKKLQEELNELQESEFNDIYEYADVLETLFSIAKFKGVKISDINQAKIKKFIEKGSFSERLLYCYKEKI
jgi:predicted house-cleaning noncanonical NTP pyrophosphatase (MazG superfamily)